MHRPFRLSSIRTYAHLNMMTRNICSNRTFYRTNKRLYSRTVTKVDIARTQTKCYVILRDRVYTILSETTPYEDEVLWRRKTLSYQPITYEKLSDRLFINKYYSVTYGRPCNNIHKKSNRLMKKMLVQFILCVGCSKTLFSLFP